MVVGERDYAQRNALERRAARICVDLGLAPRPNMSGQARERLRVRRARNDRPSRTERLIDSGWTAYALEEGYYDDGGDR